MPTKRSPLRIPERGVVVCELSAMAHTLPRGGTCIRLGSMPRELKKDRIERMRKEYEQLIELFPNPKPALDYTTPLELTVATVLSAQTTDKRVNIVTQELFERFHTPADYAAADVGEIEAIIHSLGFYRSKARHLIGLGAALVANFGGQVPSTMEELVTLPGVGRKTANVVLGNAFNIPGFPVDTHVIRVTGRLRWQTEWRKPHSDPVVIEKQVTANFPPQEWTDLSHRLIFLGRQLCHAGRPDCSHCPLATTCPTAPKYLTDEELIEIRGSLGEASTPA